VLTPHLPKIGAADPATSEAVGAVAADVRARGDGAVREHARRLDGVDLAPDEWELSGARCREALGRVPRPVQAALELAVARVRAYHERQVEAGFTVRTAGAKLLMRVVPLDSVGIYVPGGKAAYPSTVIMNAVPAAVAGVSGVVMVTPPGGGAEVVMPAAQVAG